MVRYEDIISLGVGDDREASCDGVGSKKEGTRLSEPN